MLSQLADEDEDEDDNSRVHVHPSSEIPKAYLVFLNKRGAPEGVFTLPKPEDLGDIGLLGSYL